MSERAAAFAETQIDAIRRVYPSGVDSGEATFRKRLIALMEEIDPDPLALFKRFQSDGRELTEAVCDGVAAAMVLPLADGAEDEVADIMKRVAHVGMHLDTLRTIDRYVRQGTPVFAESGHQGFVGLDMTSIGGSVMRVNSVNAFLNSILRQGPPACVAAMGLFASEHQSLIDRHYTLIKIPLLTGSFRLLLAQFSELPGVREWLSGLQDVSDPATMTEVLLQGM